MLKRTPSEFRTTEDCNGIRKEKEDEIAKDKKDANTEGNVAKRWRFRTILVCVLGAVGILSTMLMAHVANETEQNVAIGETRVKVDEIEKHVEKLNKMDDKLDIIIERQKARP